MGSDDEDDLPQLSADTLGALREFYSERDSREKRFQDLKTHAEESFENGPITMEAFAEDWNASQFWYTDATSLALAKQLLHDASDTTSIAVVSAPSAYVKLRELRGHLPEGKHPTMKLLEIDERFAVFRDDFVRYDFNEPTKLPAEMQGAFDRVICDPPFLSEDCQTRTAITARWLLKKQDVTVIVCTGERMESLIHRLYAPYDVKTTTFEPAHAKGLSNEFRCYANVEGEAWQLRR